MSADPEARLAPPDGSLTAADGASLGQQQAEPSEEMKAALRQILEAQEKADEQAWIAETRRVREQREFWAGNHYLAWDPVENRVLNALTLPEVVQDQDPPTAHVDNLYLAFGLDFVAVVAGARTKTIFWPADASRVQDQAAAEAAVAFAEHVRKSNRDLHLRIQQAYLAYNDGWFGIYVRPVADGQRFGVKELPVQEEQIQADPTTGQPIPCLVTVDTQEVPRAEVVMDVCDALKLRKPPEARSVEECGYLTYSYEIPRARGKALYPKMAEKIQGGSSGDSSSAWAVTARRGLEENTGAQGMASLQSRLTYKRAWLAPWTFYDAGSEELTKQLLKAYPNGCRLVFLGDVLCEVVGESMLERWVLSYAYPGTGNGTPSVGYPMMQLQKPYNELLNLHLDKARFQIAMGFADPSVFDPDAFGDSRVRPGEWRPAKGRPGMPLQNSFAFTPTPQTDPADINLRENLAGPRAQHASGLAPSVWGGVAGGAGETASGYDQMRQQAMQRLALAWLSCIKDANERADLLAVRQFVREKLDDVQLQQEGPDGQPATKTITVNDLEGEIRIKTDADASFPVMPSEKRAFFFQALGTPLASIVMAPENLDLARAAAQIPELTFPGEAARRQQRTEIDGLLEWGLEMAGQVDPMTGKLPPPPITVDPVLDDHENHQAEIKAFAESKDGMRARQENPDGFRFIVEHFLAHSQAGQMVAGMLGGGPPGMPPGMPGAGPGGPPPGPGGPPGGGPKPPAGSLSDNGASRPEAPGQRPIPPSAPSANQVRPASPAAVPNTFGGAR